MATAFFWRHKILEAIKKYMGFGSVDGVIEADETSSVLVLRAITRKARHSLCQENLIREAKEPRKEVSPKRRSV